MVVMASICCLLMMQAPKMPNAILGVSAAYYEAAAITVDSRHLFVYVKDSTRAVQGVTCAKKG